MQEKLAGRGFTVLGFPCNQFGAQEPGTEAEIEAFAKSKYGCNFPLFAKVEINGDGACDLYQWLKVAQSGERPNGDIAWNFTKFLIDGAGAVVQRFEPQVAPEDIEEAIKAVLG